LVVWGGRIGIECQIIGFMTKRSGILTKIQELLQNHVERGEVQSLLYSGIGQAVHLLERRGQEVVDQLHPRRQAGLSQIEDAA